MITFKIDGAEYSVKNNLSEFTIGEFESITAILVNEEYDKIDKYSKLFNYLGVPESVIDNCDTSTFFQMVRDFSDMGASEIDYLTAEKLKTIEVNGRTYTAYEDEFKLTVKQMKLVERAIKNNPNLYIAELMAILFKDDMLTDNEHYVDAHLKNKAKIFRENLNIETALPYVGHFSKELLNNIQTYSQL